MVKKIITGALILFVTAIVAVFASSVSSVEAGPLRDDPTPTPIIEYWTGPYQSYVWTQGDGSDVGLDEMTETAWCLDADGDADNCDITAPENNSPAGVIITLNSKSYDGDSRVQQATNTNFAKKFTDEWGDPYMSPGESICVGTSAGCSSVGMSVDPNSDWEGYVDGDPYDYIEDVRIHTELGYSGMVNFSVQPIWYGEWNCVYIEPENREEISTGLLFGDDETGEIFDLVANQEYVLLISGGPWNDGTDDRYDVGVRFKTSVTEDPPDGEWGEWAELSTLTPSEDICNPDAGGEDGTVYMFVADPDEQAQIQFRVNDSDEEFEDNTGDVEYYWLGGEEGTGLGCENQWTLGSKVAESLVHSGFYYRYNIADDYAGGTYSGRVAPGGSYMYRVDGSYFNNGTETKDTYVYPGSSGSPEWTPSQAFIGGNDFCENETSEMVSYYGITASGWDSGDNLIIGSTPYTNFPDWTNNSVEEITVSWYEANWTAPASDCGTKYSQGTFIESPILFANNEDGRTYPVQTNGLVTGQVYYLESQGTAYSRDGDPSWDFQISDSLNGLGNPIWESPDAFFDCITPIDQNRNGHYWEADAETFMLRATTSLTGDWDDNAGTIKFNLYGAIPNEVPDEDDCGDYYDLNQLTWRGEVDADDTSGYKLDSSLFDPGSKYAIKITGSYTDPDGTGKTAEIRRYAHGMSTPDWDDMSDWVGALCYEQDGSGYDIVYYEATTGADYEIRAYTPTGNSGTMEFEVWELEQSRLTVQGCEYNYADIDAWYVVKQGDQINANNEGAEYDGEDNVIAITGYIMANSFSDEELTYKIETSMMPNDYFPWTMEISPDGGQTWVYLEDWVDCWVDLGKPEARGYFTTPVDETGPFVLRMYDVGTWNDNYGGVYFHMWVDAVSEDPGDVWSDPEDPLSWGAGCYAVCVKPTFLEDGLSVGAWVEYARCRLTSWLAFCPWHAEALEDMRDSFGEVQPFKTIYELVSLGSMIRSEVESYQWNPEGGGDDPNEGRITAPANWVLYPGDSGGDGGVGVYTGITGEDSIWGSGEIDLTPTSEYTFRTECSLLLADTLGTRIAPSVCFGVNVLDQLGLRMWFQMLWDIFCLIALGIYIKRAWIDKMQ